MEIRFLNTMWEKITNNYFILCFVAIVMLGIMLRFFNLSTNPPSLTWDEVSWGYNAYTIGLTGKDEFGQIPFTFLESFGDFKPPVYAFLSVIPVWIFGLTEFSTRFVSALFGVLSVIVTYFLVCEIFFQSKQKKHYALLTSFLVAISPWHILLSRAAFEANVATFFIILGVFIFLLSTREAKNVRYLIFSLLSFVVAMNTFNTSRVFLPLLGIVLICLRYKILLKKWKLVILSSIIPILLLIPLALFSITPQAKLRYEEVNIFSDIKVIERVNKESENVDNNFISKLIYNRRFAYGVEYMSHYLDHFNPAFLFIKGDGNPKFSIQDVGQMYIWELPFLIIGVIMLIRRREGVWVLVPLWLLLGIVPAATARETPHALRIETTLPMFQILVAYGIITTLSNIKAANIFLKRGFIGALCVLIFVCFIYFVHNYFTHYPIKYASEWQYGYKDAIRFSEQNKNKYKNIYFTKDLGRPYMYVLFYGKYPPQFLLKNATIEREALGFVHVNKLGKYVFADEFPEPLLGDLYINTADKFPEGAKKVKTFYLPDGKAALVAYEK